MALAGEVKTDTVLAFNLGSSSLKFSLFQFHLPMSGGGGGRETLLARGEVERIGTPGESFFWIRDAEGRLLENTKGDHGGHEIAVKKVFSALERLSLPGPRAVGHRVVHGGPRHASPAIIDRQLLNELKELIPFAPLHLPSEIKCMEAVARHFPKIAQAACFDTAFHRRMPETAQRFPLPDFIWDAGVRRYGFHGLSYEHAVSALGEREGNLAGGRAIIAHLGNGASMAAVKNGMPMDTTMGFTPAGGFMMGTRSGDLDPGVLLYLMAEKGYDAGRIERLVNHEAGLLGVSGISPDMKTLLESNDPRAALAVDMFCYQLRKHTGALAAALGGLDTFVFTGGIGERAAKIRRDVCAGMGHLGIRLAPPKNEAHSAVISTPDSPCAVLIIPANEDLMIARHTFRLTGSA